LRRAAPLADVECRYSRAHAENTNAQPLRMTPSTPFEEVEQAFAGDAEATGSNVWTGVVHALRRNAPQSNLSAEQYRDVLFRASRVLQTLAAATGRLREDAWRGKILEVGDFWSHATYRNLIGVDPVELDERELADAFSGYQKLPMQTPYLDWVFLDAHLFHVYFMWQRNVDEDALAPGEIGTWLPRVASMMKSASDVEREHALLLELKMGLIRGALKIVPTVIGVAAGLALLYFDWLKMGTAILVIVFLYLCLRLLRWIVRVPLRRRARRFLGRLGSAYALLDEVVIPTKVLHRAADEALQIYGERLMFGVAFWAVLDDVCERYPSVLNLRSDWDRQGLLRG
jgi:hypothetical protein